MFIGAGASFGARSNEVQPPLGDKLLKFLYDHLPYLADSFQKSALGDCLGFALEAYKIVEKYVGVSSFEKLISKLTIKEREIVHRALAMAFAGGGELNLGFEAHSDLYDKLLCRLEFERGGWAVISLNYDVLFEQALERSHFKYHYPHIDMDKKQLGIPVFKPHGSINFFARADHPIAINGLAELGMPTQYYQNSTGELMPQLPNITSVCTKGERIAHFAATRTRKPIIANYTIGKEADVNEITLQQIRTEALSLVATAEKLIVVGVNPMVSELDDEFSWGVFNLGIMDTTIVTGPSDRDAAMQKFPNAKVVCDLSKFLEGALRECCEIK